VHLRSFAELRGLVPPPPFARIPWHAHGIRVLHRSIFAASLSAPRTEATTKICCLRVAETLSVEKHKEANDGEIL
jgi:hypothetical protein